MRALVFIVFIFDNYYDKLKKLVHHNYYKLQE
jgi:hypothetical protein